MESAVLLEPVGVYGSELVLALTTPVVGRILDVHPAISSKSDSTRVVDAERGFGQETCLIGLWAVVFVAFRLEIPVVEVGEVPGHDRVVVNEADID